MSRRDRRLFNAPGLVRKIGSESNTTRGWADDIRRAVADPPAALPLRTSRQESALKRFIVPALAALAAVAAVRLLRGLSGEAVRSSQLPPATADIPARSWRPYVRSAKHCSCRESRGRGRQRRGRGRRAQRAHDGYTVLFTTTLRSRIRTCTGLPFQDRGPSPGCWSQSSCDGGRHPSVGAAIASRIRGQGPSKRSPSVRQRQPGHVARHTADAAWVKVKPSVQGQHAGGSWRVVSGEAGGVLATPGCFAVPAASSGRRGTSRPRSPLLSGVPTAARGRARARVEAHRLPPWRRRSGRDHAGEGLSPRSRCPTADRLRS